MINILPYRQKKMVARIRFLRLFTATVVALTILVLTGGALLLPILVSINSRFTLANTQIETLEKSGAVTSPVDVAALDARVHTLTTKLAVNGGVSPTEYVASVRQIAPAGITLNGFAVVENTTNPTLKLTGVATTRETLQQFIAALGKRDGVSSVDSPVSNYVKSTNSEFTITVTFK